MSITNRIALLTLAGLLTAGAATANDIWLEPDRASGLRVEMSRPRFDRIDLSTFSAVWTFSGQAWFGDGLRFDAELPLAWFDLEGPPEASSGVGNPYLGLATGADRPGLGGEFGVRLPFAPDDEYAGELAALGDLVDRYEAFLPDVLSFSAGLLWQNRSPSGTCLRVRATPVVWLDTGDTLADGSELWLRYSFQVVQQEASAAIGVGLSGRYFATSGGSGGFGEKSLHEADVFANLRAGRWTPTLRVRLPLDKDLADFNEVSFVLGLGVSGSGSRRLD